MDHYSRRSVTFMDDSDDNLSKPRSSRKASGWLLFTLNHTLRKGIIKRSFFVIFLHQNSHSFWKEWVSTNIFLISPWRHILWLLLMSTHNICFCGEIRKIHVLTLVLLNPDIPWLCKQCRSRSVGFWRSQLIWICTVCHLVCEFVSMTWIK